jgi:ABC-type multidrug transport system ATPase subunit
MKIVLDKVGRRYNREWIFRNISHSFESKSHTAILGSNGSGKSTLAQVVMGYISPSEGNIKYQIDSEIAIEKIYKHVAIASPYIDLFEDFTVKESIAFQKNLKPFVNNLSNEQIIDKIELAGNKAIKYFSSGMKQRVKLALAIMSDAKLLVLDEPTSNLDHKSIDWYQQLIEEFNQDKTILVCSNKQEHEYHFCTSKLNVEDFKK